MVARMRLLYIGVFSLSILTFFQSIVFAIPPEINSSLAPGVDGMSVTASQSALIPPAHSSITQNSSNNNSRNRISPYIWSFTYVPFPSNSDSSICKPTSANYPVSSSSITPEFGPEVAGGVLRRETLTNRTTGEIVRVAFACFLPGQQGSFIATPPTYNQIWSELYSQTLDDTARSSGAYVAPRSPGLTGITTKIWAEFPDGQEINREISFPGGYELNASVYISKFSVFIKDKEGKSLSLTHLSPNSDGKIIGGSFENPIATHIFRTEGNYVISTGIVWTGRNTTLSGPGIDNVSIPIGSIRIEINREYEVRELLPALVD